MVASINSVMLLGNLCRDPELKYTPSGTAVCRLGLAMNRVWYDQKINEKREDVCYVDVDVWGKQGESANQYLSKGRQVAIQGRLQLDQWTDKDTQQKRSKLKVVCERMTFVGNKGDGPQRQHEEPDNRAQRPQREQQRFTPPAKPAPQSATTEEAFPDDAPAAEISESEIPF